MLTGFKQIKLNTESGFWRPRDKKVLFLQRLIMGKLQEEGGGGIRLWGSMRLGLIGFLC